MMNKFKYGKATCYSGYREGQSPHLKKYPSYEEVLEDLLLLEKEFKYIRLYDPSQHAVTTLRVIREEKLIDSLVSLMNPIERQFMVDQGAMQIDGVMPTQQRIALAKAAQAKELEGKGISNPNMPIDINKNAKETKAD